MTKLDKLINALNTDKYAAVTIKNINTNQVIYNNLISESVLNQFGSAEKLFEQLITDGNTNVQVEPKRKNGNNFKPVDEIFTLSPDAPVQTLAIAMPAPSEDFSIEKKKKKKKKKKDFFGLNGGLSAPELIRLNVEADKVGDLKERNRKLEDENARLLEKNAELKEEQLLKKYTAENNESRNNMIMMGLQNAPMLLGALGVKMAPTGLGAPDADLPEVQSKIMAIVKSTEATVNEIILKTLQRLQSTNPDDEFKAAFFQCLTDNKII